MTELPLANVISINLKYIKLNLWMENKNCTFIYSENDNKNNICKGFWCTSENIMGPVCSTKERLHALLQAGN